jgi:hypothetical protein
MNYQRTVLEWLSDTREELRELVCNPVVIVVAVLIGGLWLLEFILN